MISHKIDKKGQIRFKGLEKIPYEFIDVLLNEHSFNGANTSEQDKEFWDKFKKDYVWKNE